MRHTQSQKRNADSCTSRQLVGLRMPGPEHDECKALAAKDDRSVAQFALMIYRLGLATYKKQAAKSRRGAA